MRSALEPPFHPPADGRLTDAQIDTYVRVRKAMSAAGSETEAATRLGVSPAEFDWVRGRIVEALLALDSRQATTAVVDGYGRALTALREARQGSVQASSARRVEAEIAAFERERQATRRPDPLVSVVAANAAKVEKRRAEIQSAAP